MFIETNSKTVTQITAIMVTGDAVGIQTRAMTEAQCMENEAQQDAVSNQDEGQRTVQDTGEIARHPAMNPTPRWNWLRLIHTRLQEHEC